MINDLLAGWAELNEYAPGYCEAREQYYGDVDEVFASPKIRHLIKQTGDAYRFNLIAGVVDTLAARVKLRSVTGPTDAVTARIEDIWDANDMDVWTPHLIRQCFMYGDVYTSVWTVDPSIAVAEDGTPEDNPDDQMIMAGIEIVVHDPENTRIVYDEATQRRKLFAITRWCVKDAGGQSVWRVNLVYPHAIERWISTNESGEGNGVWRMYFEPDEEPNPDAWLQEVAVPGELNFFHFRTDVPYGMPEHYRGYGCQRAINKLLITQITTVEKQGWKERYKLTDPGAELDTAGDNPDWDDDTDAVLTNQPMGIRAAGTSSNLRGGPGTITTFTGTKSVGEFSPADPATFTDPAEFYIRMMAQVTHTPVYAIDPTGDAPSGEALKTADFPIANKAEDRKRTLTGPTREQWRYALQVSGAGAVEGIEVQWAPTELAIGSDDWAVVQAKQDAGVPQDVALTEAGYDAMRVKEWLDATTETMDLGRRVDLLNSIGDALTKLGTAANLGAIDQTMVQEIVTRVLPPVVDEP